MTTEKRQKVDRISIQRDVSVLQALEVMDRTYAKLLLVFDGERFISLLSIGDIQRAIVRQTSVSASISSVLRPKVRVAHEMDTLEAIRQQMIEYRAECMPVLTVAGDLADVVFWEDLFPSVDQPKARIDAPVVVMAGGQGTRLKPLTNVIPKPLIPVGEKPILEDICDRFHDYGVNDFYVSLNYKAGMVESYFQENPKPYRLHYFREDRPLGTAGSLRLLANVLDRPFIVSNCDILVEHDFSEIFAFHKEHNNELTAVAALKVQKVPYGLFECDAAGMLTSIKEKPSLPFLINVGVYVLQPDVLKEIPDEFFHITHLMDVIKARGGRVGVFPISEGDWLDMGEWDEYVKAMFKRQQKAAAKADRTIRPSIL